MVVAVHENVHASSSDDHVMRMVYAFLIHALHLAVCEVWVSSFYQ